MEELRKLLTLGVTSPDRVGRSREVEIEKIDRSKEKIVAIARSQSKRPIIVSIEIETGRFNCNCEDFLYRKIFCKHLVALFKKLNSDERKKFLENLEKSKKEIKISKFVSTGSETIDQVLGGGIPIGMVLNVIGESKIGKTLFSVQCSCKASVDLDSPVLYIDTESVFVSDVAKEKFLKMFEKRFGKKPEVDFIELRDISSFSDFLGLDIKVGPSEKGKRIDALIQYSTTTEESPIFECFKELGYKMLVIDSFSALIKKAVPVPPQQNFPTRAAIINVVFGRLDEIVSKLEIPAIVVNHISKSPELQNAHGRTYGGSAMLYNSKLILQILPHKDENKRRIKTVYVPCETTRVVEVELKKDYGYV